MKIKGKEAVSPVIGVILMVAITVVLAAVLYVWVSGFMTTTSGGVYALSTGVWTLNATSTAINASVISTTPTAGILISSITWQLYNTATATVSAPTGPQYRSTTGAALTTSDYLGAGCSVGFTAPSAGTYKVRAIVGGSQIYESASFVVT